MVPPARASIASRIVEGKRSASDSYAFPSSPGGSSSSFSIPCRPAAITAANARYGFASPPGIRVSALRAAPWPTTLNPQVRLSFPHASVVGAQEPAANRLYELIVGARNTASSLKHAICPASQREKSASSVAKHGSPSLHSEEWM